MRRQSLNGQWQFRQEDSSGEWHDGSVPGGVCSDLFAADEIPDPYYADNELDLQWVGKTDWVYRRTLDVDPEFLEEERVVLHCAGLDTVATIKVNGDIVGTSNNMHRAYEFDVAGTLEPGENELSVHFSSPVEYSVERRNTHPYNVPTLRYPIDQPARNFIRKAQCHYGWDWGPCLPTVGIWRDIELLAYSAPTIDYVTTEQVHESDMVSLTARVGLDTPSATDATVTVAVAGTEVTESVSLTPGKSSVPVTVAVEDPDLWWPNGHGDQPLYDLDVTVETEQETHEHTDRVGFRDIVLVREEDGAGESFYFKVNGEPIFAKGANWIPMDALHGRVTEERYESLLSGAVAANMNMIRVWGGGYYEKDAFYETCDELGLLVWQDFMFACSLYPADDEFLGSVEAEARYQTRRLSHHASLALWCGNNENEESLHNWFADEDHINQLAEDYEALYLDTIGEVVAEEDPGKTYWPASPSSGEDVEDPYEMGRGDVHYWDVWHEGASFDEYETIEPRFVSEFGYQSFPPMDVLESAVPEGQRNPTAPIMEHHQRHDRGNQLILNQMAESFRIPFDFEDFVYLSQVQQGLAMRTAIEHFRRLQPHCMGSLYWQLNDLWPCASWSSIGYGGDWKALQYMARRFHAPALVTTVEAGGPAAGEEAEGRTTGAAKGEETDEVEVWLTNDLAEPLEGSLLVEVVSVDGVERIAETYDVAVEGKGSTVVATVDPTVLDASADRTLVRATYEGDVESYPSFWFEPAYKGLDLPETDVGTAVDGDEVTVTADDAALFVALDVEDGQGAFSDDYFHLVPGEEYTVSFDGDLTGDALADALTVTHLRETY